IRSLQGGVTAKAKEILTPEQFAKYEKLQQERREQLNSRIERRPQGDRKPTSDQPATEKAQTLERVCVEQLHSVSQPARKGNTKPTSDQPATEKAQTSEKTEK